MEDLPSLGRAAALGLDSFVGQLEAVVIASIGPVCVQLVNVWPNIDKDFIHPSNAWLDIIPS